MVGVEGKRSSHYPDMASAVRLQLAGDPDQMIGPQLPSSLNTASTTPLAFLSYRRVVYSDARRLATALCQLQSEYIEKLLALCFIPGSRVQASSENRHQTAGSGISDSTIRDPAS